MPFALEQEKVVKLPIFCHSVIDDLPMSLEAFRMYAHLARKWGNGKKGALGSYVDMGEHCYRQAFPKASSETLRRKAIAAVAELQELNLLHKETRQGHDGRNLANSYILHDLKVIVSSHQGGCDDTRVVRMHPKSAIAPLEDTNSEDSPVEDSLPLTPSQGSGEPEREREDKTEDERSGSKPHPLTTDRDQLELLGKKDETTVRPAHPLTSSSKQPEPLGFEPTNSGLDSDSAAAAYLEQKYSFNNSNPPDRRFLQEWDSLETRQTLYDTNAADKEGCPILEDGIGAPNPTYPDARSLELSEKEHFNEKQDSDSASVSLETNPPSPTPIYRDREDARFNRTAALQDWEIRPGVPYPAFVKWRSQHYLKQGGHWADAAIANAKSEIRNNPQRAADLWSQFLEYSNTAAGNALAHQAAGMTPTLPSCFADSQPATPEGVIAKLEALVGVAQVALPQGVATPSCTETAPYMPAAPTRLYAAATSSSASAASEPTLGILVAGKQAAVFTPLGTEIPDTQTAVAPYAVAMSSFAQPTGTKPPATVPAGTKSASPQPPPPPQEYANVTSGMETAADLEWDTQQQEQNMRRLAQMIQSIKSMPSPQRKQPEPTSHFQKMRSMLQSDEPALRNEAIAWLYRCQDVEPVFDSDGNPYDFTEIEF